MKSFVLINVCKQFLLVCGKQKYLIPKIRIEAYSNLISLFNTYSIRKGCPNGYTYLDGHEFGTDLILDICSVSSIEQCAQRCNNLKGCKSIEWSDSGGCCHLLTHGLTEGPNYQDLVFCSKGQGT